MWSPQLYIQNGLKQGESQEILNIAAECLDQFYSQNPDAPALLTLNHLALRAQVPYWRLRTAVERSSKCYQHFKIRKRSGGYRVISVPHPDLMKVQRWLAIHILNKQPVHPASFAFKPKSSITSCAARHTGARWLVKIDISTFFNSISEIPVYRIFRSFGYSPLIAFELARLTTCISEKSTRYSYKHWKNFKRHVTIQNYQNDKIGHIPQGAPTSPMLSNLFMRNLDDNIATAASMAGLIYTRYSDDLIFSTRNEFSRKQAVKFIRSVSLLLRSEGLFLNARKTIVVPPGARKVVLGLVVDGDKPRLSREFRNRLRQHFHYLEKFGPVEHMQNRNFETTIGMKYHIRGQIDFANMVDKQYADKMLNKFNAIDWVV